MIDKNSNYENNVGQDVITEDRFEQERKSVLDIVVKVIGFLFFFVFLSAGLSSIIFRNSYLIDTHHGVLTYKRYSFDGINAVILGFHYIGLSAFFLVKTLLRNIKSEKQHKIKYTGIVLSLGLSLVTFIIVGMQISVFYTISRALIITVFAFIIYGLYKGITKYI